MMPSDAFAQNTYRSRSLNPPSPLLNISSAFALSFFSAATAFSSIALASSEVPYIVSSNSSEHEVMLSQVGSRPDTPQAKLGITRTNGATSRPHQSTNEVSLCRDPRPTDRTPLQQAPVTPAGEV